MKFRNKKNYTEKSIKKINIWKKKYCKLNYGDGIRQK